MKSSELGRRRPPRAGVRLVRTAVLMMTAYSLALASTANANVTISSVQGTFYKNTSQNCTFDPTNQSAVFTQQFSGLNFNPPVGLIAGSLVGPTTIPLTNVVTDASGAFLTSQAATGNGSSAGMGLLTYFFATFTGTIVVDGSQQVSFDVYHDDGFVFGVGGNAQRVKGILVAPPVSGQTAALALPVVGSYNRSTSTRQSNVVVQFPHAGEYDFEMDYTACKGTTRTLTLFADQQFIAVIAPTPTPTATPTPTDTPEAPPTPTGTISPGMPTPTGTISPGMPTPTGTPGTPISTQTPTETRTPPITRTITATPTPTEPLGVQLIMGDATGNPGDSVTLSVEFFPSASDGQPFGPDEIAILDLVLAFPNLDFDPTDTNGDGIPDAIVFNPGQDPALDPFTVSTFNVDLSPTTHMLDLEVGSVDEGNEILPGGLLMTITFKIPERTTGGDLQVLPTTVRASDLQNALQPVSLIVPGVVHSSPPFTFTPVPAQTVTVNVSTKGGGCRIDSDNPWLPAPLLGMAALLWLRRRGRKKVIQ